MQAAPAAHEKQQARCPCGASRAHSVPLENSEVDFFVSFYDKSASAVTMPLLRFKQGSLIAAFTDPRPATQFCFYDGFYEASF